MNRYIRLCLFMVGFCLCIYPFVSEIIENNHQKNVLDTYESHVTETSKIDKKNMLEDAREYNQILFQTNMNALSKNEIWREKIEYIHILDPVGTGMIGSLEIPKIRVNLPIYHGTEEENLAVGAGHLQGSSLPVGGRNTRAVLTGHRGLPTAKLFTRLDELKKGDFFYIHVLDEELVYCVKEIYQIRPDEVEKLEIKEGRDMVSLVTCTPYGINTHRLVVDGERVEKEEEINKDTGYSGTSIRELIFLTIPMFFLFYIVAVGINQKKRGKK